MSRPSWDEVWRGVAAVVATRSRCVRSQVGVVVVDGDNRIRSTGYNGAPSGLYVKPAADCLEFCPRARRLADGGDASAGHDDCVASHAEMNALMFGDRSERLGGTLYSTRVPCLTCAKAVANSGVVRVVFPVTAADDHLEPHRSIDLLLACGLRVIATKDTA